MTYSMLLLAATTASAATGSGVMLAFGLGTLPSMVTATVAFERMARTLSARATLRNVAGALLLGFGLWTAGNALYHASAGHAGTHSGHARNEHAGHDATTDAPAGPHHHE
jgi:sulfite exporter TauE/SafE